jgi:hypothetical protein
MDPLSLIRRLGIITAFTFFATTRGSAQDAHPDRFELEPLLGYYLPLGSFAPASVYYTSLPNKPSELSGLALGVEARVSITRRLSVQLQAAVANSTIGPTSTPEGSSGPFQAQVAIVTAEAVYDVAPRAENVHFWISGGPALIRHGGEAYSNANAGAPITFGGALGARLKLPLASHLSLAAGVETILYQLNIKLPPESSLNPGKLESGSQADLLLHVGLVWNWK